MRVTEYQQGIPSWFELETTDEAAVAPFYDALFGWRDDPNSMGDPNGAMYHMQLIDGDSVAAIFKQDPENSKLGLPPHWNTYITVKDLDAVAAKVPGTGRRHPRGAVRCHGRRPHGRDHRPHGRPRGSLAGA